MSKIDIVGYCMYFHDRKGSIVISNIGEFMALLPCFHPYPPTNGSYHRLIINGSMGAILGLICFYAPIAGASAGCEPHWHYSVQYLGLTYHPDGGTTPEVYPLKFDRKAYLVLSIGAAGDVDYSLGKLFFLRLKSTVYKDCAFLWAGALHFSPHAQYTFGNNRINLGIGPIFSFRQDWHRFKQFVDDDFYGDRVYKGWQYRFYGTALELEYLRRITKTLEMQCSVIPGAPLVITFLFGVRFALIG
jgi:hypothetical protein